MATEAKDEATPRKGKRSRREILAGAAGALGVIAVQTVGRATPAQATDGDVVLGVDGQSTGGNTGVTTTNLTGLHGTSTYQFGTGVLGNGDTGVFGEGGTYGVYGRGTTGVYGEGGTTGVYGTSGTTGVYGKNTGSMGIGVHGETAGVGSAVYGQATASGVGVYGETVSGAGVTAKSTGPGTALDVIGKATFSRSGKATIQAGNTTVLVQNVALTSASLVLATLQQFQAGVSVAAVVPSVANSRFTIRLNQAPTGNLKVAWFIVN